MINNDYGLFGAMGAAVALGMIGPAIANRSKRERAATGLRDPRVPELLAKAQAGDLFARNELMTLAVPLVRAVAEARRRGAELDDLVQAGLVGAGGTGGGVLRAIELWDPSKDVEFVTYATEWIRHSVDAESAQSALGVRPPARTRRWRQRHEAKQLGAELRRDEIDVTELGTGPSESELIAAIDQRRFGAPDRLRKLPPELRAVAYGRLVEGKSWQQLETETGINRRSLRRRLDRALTELRGSA